MHELIAEASGTIPSMGSALLAAFLKNERLLIISSLSRFFMHL